MTAVYIKFLTMLMSLVLSINSFAFPITAFSDNAEIDYAFANSEAGSAAGTVTVSAKAGGKYELYWGNQEEERLSVQVGDYTAYYTEFAEVKVSDGKGSAEILEFTAIPEGAETVLAYKNKLLMGTYDIPDNKLTDFGEESYTFGAISDVHFNRYNLSLTGDDACVTLPNALSFIENFDVELVAISGDISNKGERDAFEKFNRITSEFDFPVYTCTGNHDVSREFSLENWNELMNVGVYGETKADGVKDVASNNLDFVYAPDGINGDVFIFLSQFAWDYNSPESRLLTDEQLDWLEKQLEEYKDTTVYLFFHTFLNNPVSEELRTGEGNLINNAGNYYDIPFTDGCADEVRFRGLMDKYENVVFFNGHSHWSYDMQELNPNLNIANYNGEYATMVHLSSVSSPRKTTADSEDTTEHFMRSSEGMVVTVYEDYILFRACDFLKGEMLAYATYYIEK